MEKKKNEEKSDEFQKNSLLLQLEKQTEKFISITFNYSKLWDLLRNSRSLQ